MNALLLLLYNLSIELKLTVTSKGNIFPNVEPEIV